MKVDRGEEVDRHVRIDEDVDEVDESLLCFGVSGAEWRNVGHRPASEVASPLQILHRVAVALSLGAALALASTGVATAQTEEPVSAADEVLTSSPVVGDAADRDVQSASVSGNEVAVKGSSSEVRVTLPVSQDAETTTSGGLVELSDNASSTIVPVVLNDGSVAIHSVLNDRSAPTTYEYQFDFPAGTSFQIEPATGAATAINSDGAPVLFVSAPWASDANGAPVPTHYTADGDTITQHVLVDDATAFPVVADPWAGIDLVAGHSWTSVAGSGWKLNVDPTAWARGFTGSPSFALVGEAGWSELYNKVASQNRYRMNQSGRGQYICHMGFAGFDAQWNLELWKPYKDLVGWTASGCN